MIKEKDKIKLRSIARQYKVRLYFNKEENLSGYFANKNGRVSIHLCKYARIKTFFHELGHLHCYRNKIYTTYHNCNNIMPSMLSSCEYSLWKKSFIATALRAERWVDNWGEKEMKKHFPKRKYEHSYKEKDSAKWLKNYFKPYFK